MRISPHPGTRWSATARRLSVSVPPRRKTMPQTEVDDDVSAAMYAIARHNGVSLYDVCRRAYRELIENHPELLQPEEPPYKDGEEWQP